MTESKQAPTPLLQLYPLGRGTGRAQMIQDQLELANNGKQEAVDEMVNMLEDLHRRGRRSRYLQKLQGMPLFELKPTIRGGHKGGARVYLAFNQYGEALLLNAEAKPQDTAAPNTAKIMQALAMLDAYKNGQLRTVPNKASTEGQGT